MSFEKKENSFKSICGFTVWILPTSLNDSRKTNFKINNIHERNLRMVYKDNTSSFEELLRKDKSFCIHQKNIQSLTIEFFRVKNILSNRIMCDVFETRNLNYNLRSQTDFIRTCVNNSSFGLNYLKYLATKI